MKRPRKILLIEGDVLIRQPLAAYLRDCGYVVIEAANGDEARKSAVAWAGEIDVALIDATTEGAGFELNRWMRAEAPDVHVILTGSPAQATERAGELCARNPTAVKPYDHKLLLAQIRRLIATREQA